MGWGTAVWVTLLRVVVASLLLGTFLSPTFLISSAGAVAALVAMGGGHILLRHHIGPVGYGLLGAVAHISAQFAVAYGLFIPHTALFRLLPLLVSAAIIFGLFNGIIAARALNTLTDRN